MQSQQGQLTTVQILLKGKLSELLIQYKDLLDKLKKVDHFITEAETKILTMVTKKVTACGLKLASHFDVMQDKLNICIESIEDIVYFDYSDSDEKETCKRSSVTQESSCLASDIFKKHLETLEERISSLENRELSKETKLVSRLSNTEAKQMIIERMITRKNDVVIQCEADLSKIRHDVSRLTSKQEWCCENFQELRKKLEALEKLRDALNQVNKNVSSRGEISENLKEMELNLTQLGSKVTKLESLSTIQDSKESGTVMPAFCAEAAGKPMATVGNVIEFSEVTYNIMDCYDKRTSKFKAPSRGLYFFSTSINTNSKGTLCVAICHNGTQAAWCGTPEGIDFQTSTSVLLELSPGDMVWVETDRQTSTRGVQIGSGYSNFLGLKLR